MLHDAHGFWIAEAGRPEVLPPLDSIGVTAAAAFLSMGALDTHANPLGLPIGCQTYPVRHKSATVYCRSFAASDWTASSHPTT